MSETFRERGERELAETRALDPTALEVGAERNLAYQGPRGEWGFPRCHEDGCRRESIGPFSYHCYAHFTDEKDASAAHELAEQLAMEVAAA